MKQHLTEREFQREMKKIQKENEQKQKQLLLKAEKEKFEEPRHIETSKILAVYLFGLLNVIIIYSMVAMWWFGDLSYLGVLISDIAAQVVIYAIYCMKAYHAKKQSEQLKFERERLTGPLGDALNAGGECGEAVSPKNSAVDVAAPGDEAVG